MSVASELIIRSNNQCELCSSTKNLSIYDVPPNPQQRIEDSIFVCEKCSAQLNKKEALDPFHWDCLTDAMWSEVTAVQVVAWRSFKVVMNVFMMRPGRLGVFDIGQTKMGGQKIGNMNLAWGRLGQEIVL